MNYAQAVDEWGAYRVATNDVSEHYARKCKQVALRFEDMRLMDVCDIRPSDVMRGLLRMSQTLSPESVRKAYTFGKMVFGYLVSMDYISRNPFDSVKKPRKAQNDRHALTAEQAANLHRSMLELFDSTGDSRAAGIAIMLATGIRVGELLALDGHEVEGGVLSISNAVKDDGTIGSPKTRSSVRKIAVDSETESIIRRACPFVGITHSKMCHWWRRWADANGYDGVLIHELRHTHATLLISSGVDIKTVQTRLGHSSAMTTLDIYAHSTQDNGEAAAAVIAEALRR